MSKDRKQENIEIKIGNDKIQMNQQDIFNFMDNEGSNKAGKQQQPRAQNQLGLDDSSFEMENLNAKPQPQFKPNKSPR